MHGSESDESHGPRLERTEKRSIVWASVIRFAGAPLSALSGFVVTAMIIRSTSSVQFGIINLIATSIALLPFADLGIGAAVTTAASKLVSGAKNAEEEFVATLISALRVLSIVVIVIQVVAVCGALFHLWGSVFGVAMTSGDQWIVAFVFIAFAVCVPLGLGARVLIGAGKTHHVAAMAPATSLVVLGLTAVLIALGAPPLALSLPPVLAVVLMNAAAVVLAFRSLSRLGVHTWAANSRKQQRLLAGSMAMLIIMITLPAGLQSGRLIISHLGSEAELAEYSLAFQLYGAGYAAVAVGGTALWPIFVRRRSGREATLRLWRTSLLVGAGVGVCGLVVFAFGAPLVARLISGGSISVDHWLASLFGLFFFAQAVHLPSGMMLTVPSELRWQAWCSTATCLAAIAAALVLVPTIGAAGAVLAAAASVLLFQVVPDLCWGGRLVNRRHSGSSILTGQSA